jgi:hypothetical protein
MKSKRHQFDEPGVWRELLRFSMRQRPGKAETPKQRKLLEYWQAARLQKEHAIRKAPPKAQARSQRLSKAPWTLEGGAVESDRRKH